MKTKNSKKAVKMTEVRNQPNTGLGNELSADNHLKLKDTQSKGKLIHLNPECEGEHKKYTSLPFLDEAGVEELFENPIYADFVRAVQSFQEEHADKIANLSNSGMGNEMSADKDLTLKDNPSNGKKIYINPECENDKDAISSEKVRTSVNSMLGFEIPQHIYSEIDDIFGQIFNELKYMPDVEETCNWLIDRLHDKHILYPDDLAAKIVEYFYYYLEQTGMITARY